MPDHQEGIDAFFEMLTPLVRLVLVNLLLSAARDIKTGRKGMPGPRENNYPDLLILLNGGQNMTQIGQHLTADGVEFLRTV